MIIQRHTEDPSSWHDSDGLLKAKLWYVLLKSRETLRDAECLSVLGMDYVTTPSALQSLPTLATLKPG